MSCDLRPRSTAGFGINVPFICHMRKRAENGAVLRRRFVPETCSAHRLAFYVDRLRGGEAVDIMVRVDGAGGIERVARCQLLV